jgi:mRNA-degrading endonuclease toxin of MazEF toxin-antitoxin module
LTNSYPRQGEVYLIKALKTLGDTKKRPAVVISMNVRNELRENVLMTAGEGGLESASWLYATIYLRFASFI